MKVNILAFIMNFSITAHRRFFMLLLVEQTLLSLMLVSIAEC